MGDRSYLQLVQDFAAEVGSFKAGVSMPPAVTSQEGEAANLVRYVADANDYICNLWLDWNFLWQIETGTITAGDRTIAAAATRRSVDERSFLLNPQTTQGYFPLFVPWPNYNQGFRQGAPRTSTRPSNWSQAPNGTIYISHASSANIDWELHSWKWATRLAANSDVSPIPGSLGDRIIICRAAIIYGVREDAPELISGFSAEYQDLLEKLESTCLPNQKRSRQAEASYVPDPVLG